MIYWTIQSKEVLHILNSEEKYFPDFNKSPFLRSNSNLSNLYHFMRESYNANNKGLIHNPEKGLVFCFAQASPNRQNPISQISDIDEFRQLMEEGIRNQVIGHLLKHYVNMDCAVLRLYVPFHHNPIPVEFNNFQAIMPPETNIWPYDEAILGDIKTSIAKGQYCPSPMHSGIIQLHLPMIIKAMIVEAYDFQSLELPL